MDRTSASTAFEAQLPAELESAVAARRLLASAATAWGFGEAIRHDAALAVSELVTNAVLHARSALQLRLALLDRQVRVEVHDESLTAPDLTPHQRTQLSEHGRGLATVQALTDRIGIEQDGEGKTVWATIMA